jgi:chromosome transmission fidelity protein 1
LLRFAAADNNRFPLMLARVLTCCTQVSGYTAVAVAQTTGSVELQQTKHKQSHKQKLQASGTADAASTEPPGSPRAQQQQQQQQQLGRLSPRDGVSAIHSFIGFLLSLTNTDADGRVIIEPAAAAAAATPPPAAAPSTSTDDQESSAAAQAVRGGRMRYVLLNAARHFGRLLSSARSVLLVSGTLAPIEGLRAQLFPELPPEQLRHFECGHVVPAGQLLAVAIGSGPSGKALNLRHDSRGDATLIDELGQLLLNLAGVVPEGLVVFAPSFGYLEQLLLRWQGTGLLARLQQRKQLFR